MWPGHHFMETVDKLLSPLFAQWKTRKYPKRVSVKYVKSLLERGRNTQILCFKSLIIFTVESSFCMGHLKAAIKDLI